MIAGSCFAIGMMSYELVAFHLITTKIITANSIPLLLAFATGSGVIASLVLGKLYDRFELPAVLGVRFSFLTLLPLSFSWWLLRRVYRNGAFGYCVRDARHSA